jgi:hypothetical protein
MHRHIFFPLVSLVLAVAASAQDAGEAPLVSAAPNGMSAADVIRRFAQKEAEFAKARENYVYRQTVKVQELDGETVDGEYQMVVDITYDARGRRVESVVYSPQPTLQRVSMSPSDFEDIKNLMPFALTTENLPQYTITYLGQQKQDELNTYVFDVSPKQIVKGQRYFEGRIWVDDHDLQIVKTTGKTVPEQHLDKKGKGQEDLKPRFTTWREQVDGVFWFPTYVRADDTLHFRTGDVHIREIIKFTNYKRFGADVRVTYDGQDVMKDDKAGTEKKQPSSKPPL